MMKMRVFWAKWIWLGMAVVLASCGGKNSEKNAGATPGVMDLRNSGAADNSPERYLPVEQRLKKRQERISETLNKFGTPAPIGK